MKLWLSVLLITVTVAVCQGNELEILTQRIDQVIGANFREANRKEGGRYQLQPKIDDAGYLRRAYLILLGRSPLLQNGTRPDYSGSFTCLLAGAGVKGGQLHGATDDRGWRAIDPVSPQQLNSTIAWALGVNYREVRYSPSKRPFLMIGRVQQPPLTDLFEK